MKLKQIIKNKWGWIGAVIGALIGTISDKVEFIQPVVYPITQGISKIISSFGSDILGIMIFSLITMATIGFILGLILEKIWNKFK